MKNGSSQPLCMICAIFLMVMLGMSVARPSYSTPIEEDITGSDSLATPQPVPSAVQSSGSELSGDNPAAQDSDQGETSDESSQISGSPSPRESRLAPRATFPYIVRSGDTPAAIADLFGVQVTDLLRLNHIHDDSELMIGQTLRVPNPFLARQRELSSEIDRLTAGKQAAEQRAENIEESISGLRSQVQDLSASNKQYQHELRTLPWWQTAAILAAGAAALMLGIMLLAVIQWIIMRLRFRAVAEMNESLRRLDYRYKAALAKAELRFQELYGRRRRGIQDGQERPKTPEESEIEQLNHQLKEVLEHHLRRLEPSSSSAGRARWRERLAGIGAPMEARSIRR
jgi:LysM repeat protein